MARILICGTLAYDDIGTFASSLTPETRNVKLDRLDRAFGGCAMNIAYNLAGLGHCAVPFVYAGEDYAGDYARHVAASGISEAGIFRVPGTPSARGLVFTGRDGGQFTAFYPGPSGLQRWQLDLEAVLREGAFDAAVVAPDLPQKMAGCAARLARLPLTLWSPGQYAEMLTRADILPVLDAVDLLVANRHEWGAVLREVDAGELIERGVRAVVTNGPGPVELLPGGATIAVPPLGAEAVDPTGCGDAFIAALVSALLADARLEAAVKAGVALGGQCIRWRGAQRHPVRS